MQLSQPQGSTPAKAVRTGSVALELTDLTSKAVTFATPMPSSDYTVVFQIGSNLAVVLYASAKLAAGFTLNLSAAISGTVVYLAVQN